MWKWLTQWAAEIETSGDDAEGAPGGTRGRRAPHQHVARGRNHAAEKARRRHRCGEQDRRQRDGGNYQHDRRIDGKAGGGDLAVPLGAVGEKAAREHADGAGPKIRGQRDVGGRERNIVAAHQRHHAEIADAGVGQAKQHEKHRQHDQRRGDDVFSRYARARRPVPVGAGLGDPHHDEQQGDQRADRAACDQGALASA